MGIILYVLTRATRWFCFHTGRPSSLSLKDVAIENAQDPFMRSLVHLCKTISRSTDEIYGQNHESLLHMWRVARSINNDLRGHEELARQMGFGLDASIQTGSMGVRHTIFTTCTLNWSQHRHLWLNFSSILSHTPVDISPFLNISWPLATTKEGGGSPS